MDPKEETIEYNKKIHDIFQDIALQLNDVISLVEELDLNNLPTEDREEIMGDIAALCNTFDNPFTDISIRMMRYFATLSDEFDAGEVKDILAASRIANSKIKELYPFIEDEIEKDIYSDKLIDEDNNFIDIVMSALNAKKISDFMPTLQSSGTPKNYISPNTTLSNALQANDGKGEVIGAGPLDIPVMNIGKKNEVTIYVDASLENMEGVTLTGKPFTEYDRAVHDAVVSIYADRVEHGLPAMATADMIYRTMTHKTNQEYVSAQQKAAVTKSIDKMRKNIYLYADVTEEMKKRGIVSNPDGKTEDARHKLVLDDFLLSATHFDNKAAGGANVNGYVFREPMLFYYAKSIGQLLTVKGELLDIKEVDEKGNITDAAIANTDSRIAIKSYLNRRIQYIKHETKEAAEKLRKYERKRKADPSLPEKKLSDFTKQSNIILMETLFEATGITAPNAKTRSREYIYQVLDYWRAAGFIADYKKRKKGKTVDAVEIYF